MIICRTKNLKGLRFIYTVLTPIFILFATALIFIFALKITFNTSIDRKVVIVGVLIWIIIIDFFAKMPYKLRKAYIINKNKLYQIDILDCFHSIKFKKLPKPLDIFITALLITFIVSKLFNFMSVILLYTCIASGIIITLYSYIHAAFIMYHDISAEYTDSIIMQYCDKHIDFIVEKVINVNENYKYIKARVKVSKPPSLTKKNLFKKFYKTLKIPIDYENADYTVQELKLMM